MVLWKKMAFASLSFSLFAAAAATCQAATSKIYINGQWVKAQEEEALEAPATSFLFGLGSSKSEPLDLSKAAERFLEKNAQLLKMDQSASWVPEKVVNGDELQTHRMQKYWNGLPVLGGEALVHLRGGKVAFANADATPLEHLSSRPRIDANVARNIAFSSYRGRASRTGAPQLKVLVLGEGERKEARLVYEVTVYDRDQLGSDVHYIDANNGEESLVTSNVQTLVDRRVFVGLGSDDDYDVVTGENSDTRWKTAYADKGCPNGAGRSVWDNWRSPSSLRKAQGEDPAAAATNPQNCDKADARVMSSALAAWNNSGLVYEYYQKNHSRDSVDGKGMQLKSVVNFGGTDFQNAAWYNDKTVMLYGMGDDTNYNDFASPIDVVGHELTHGVTASTAGLLYASEAGALNESYSDVFGKLIAYRYGKTSDWKIGKDLFRDGKGFIRDMENPEVAHTKDFMYRNQTCNRYNDFCGVHTNSGIPNKAATIIAKQLGLEKTGKLYYLVLTQLLKSSSNFKEARSQTEAACATLFGGNSTDCKAVSEAYASVGI